jgi:hypothetical protein
MGDVQPDTLAAHLTAASPSTDSTPPDSAITTPSTGTLAAMNSPLIIRGTASDVGGQVAAIEISTDGGSTWNRATGTGTWMYRWIPTVAGPTTVVARAVDDTGNVETTTPSIGVTVTSPSQAPGGPVLVVTSDSNPFTHYYTEILRTEGFNLFNTADISAVNAGTLTSYDVVILGEMTLSAGQVTMFSDWVTAGGNLIATPISSSARRVWRRRALSTKQSSSMAPRIWRRSMARLSSPGCTRMPRLQPFTRR